MTQNVNFKIPKWQAAAILKIEKLQYLVNISSVSTVRHLGFLKLLSDKKTDTFCVTLPNFVEIDYTFLWISQFFAFFSEI